MIRQMITLALCLIAGIAFAQSPETYNAHTQVVEHGSAGQAVRSLRSGATVSQIKGYRVRIFFDNSQSARGQAAETLSRFRELYPAIPAYMSYENPYFKVTVGNCTSKEEAIILKGRIEGSFSRAFITMEDIPLSKLTE